MTTSQASSFHSQLQLGTMVKLWHDSRGLDYVYCGFDPVHKKAYFLKANCINQDGSVRANTKRFHIVRDASKFGSIIIVPKINRVIGDKPLKSSSISSFAKVSAKIKNFETAKRAKSKMTCTPLLDQRQSFLFTT